LVYTPYGCPGSGGLSDIIKTCSRTAVVWSVRTGLEAKWGGIIRHMSRNERPTLHNMERSVSLNLWLEAASSMYHFEVEQ
jgi:hypothetical protein